MVRVTTKSKRSGALTVHRARGSIADVLGEIGAASGDQATAAPRPPPHRGEQRQAAAARLRQQLADTDRRLQVQVQALEDGIDAALVSSRTQELRDQHAALTAALDQLAPAEAQDDEDDALTQRLGRLPDLTKSFRAAPFEIKRQTLDAFDVQIAYDEAEGRIEVSASDRLRGRRGRLGERESPPRGGPDRHHKRHSGGPLRS